MFKFDNKYKKALAQAGGKIPVETVAKNLEGYSNNQQQKAKLTKQLYHRLGANGIKNFKYTVRFYMIKNCPVTLEDKTLGHKT